MERKLIVAFSLVVGALVYPQFAAGLADGPMGAAFTYQGRLTDNGDPANDDYDFQFMLCDSEMDPCVVAGTTVTCGVVPSPTSVEGGLFTVTVDCGDDVFNGTARWLKIGVRKTSEGGSYEFLSQQAVTPAPYALALPGLWTQQNDPGDPPNIIGGYSGNIVDPNVIGATISGGGNDGAEHVVTASYGTIGGGLFNKTTGLSATIAGGVANQAIDQFTTVGGGGGNIAGVEGATICGGTYNLAGYQCTVGGGHYNAAGYRTGSPDYASCATVAGGCNNEALESYATVGGGSVNEAIGAGATVAGGNGNTAYYQNATVGGGLGNTAYEEFATVAGGHENMADQECATIGGGRYNEALGYSDTVAGGYFNAADGGYSTIGGGQNNGAHGMYSTVSGGDGNAAYGNWSTVPGGSGNWADGDWSLAAGQNARANFDGQFVWADSQPFPFPAPGELNFTPATNQFLARTTGGTVFVSAINAAGDSTAGVELPAGGSAWSPLSDRNAKENFAPVNRRELLACLAAIPVETWNYKAQHPSIRHIGPVAQDFHAAFGVGESEKRISTIDSDGVALAAIQGLYEIVQDKDAQIDCLEEQNAELEARLAAIEAFIAQQMQATEGGGR